MDFEQILQIAKTLLGALTLAAVILVPLLIVVTIVHRVQQWAGARGRTGHRVGAAFEWLRELLHHAQEAAAGTPEGASRPPSRAPTPQESRFIRLALERKELTEQQVEQCRRFQADKRERGSLIPLWDCAVLADLMDQPTAERLSEEAGELDAESVGEFRLVRKLGQGGMGSVWLARGPDDESIALKLLPPQKARERAALTRFLREAQAALRLRHENLVRGVDLGEDAGHYYFAMEFVPGRSVKDLLEEGGRLPCDEASDIVRQVCAGLAYAHQNGVIHRDIKPSNILVTRRGVAKLADLGLARYLEPDLTVLTRSEVGMGTPAYMAPEQIREAKRADARSDVYSLGATWYHMVTGRPPFLGATSFDVLQKHLSEPLTPPSRVCPDLPEAVSRTIERMMAKEPADRPRTVAEVARAIREDSPA